MILPAPFHRLMLCLIALACAGKSVLHAAESPKERYQAVRTAYEKGDFARAQKLGEGMVKEHLLSPQLFQLLGHALYRQGDLGGASLWYQRASLFPPPSPELRQNIAHIRDKTGNLSFPANSFRQQYTARLDRTKWFNAAISASWAFLFAVVIHHLFVRSQGLRTVLMLVRVLALVVATLAWLGWAWHPSFTKLQDIHVVMTPGTRAYTAATTTGGLVSPLPPGTELRRLEERGAWSYVELPPRPFTADASASERTPLRGWVQTSALTPFWPFDPGYLE